MSNHPEETEPQWIGMPAGWHGQARFFRCAFTLDKPVARAELQIAGLGYFEARLNGAKVGDHVLTPDPTDVSRRVPYDTLEIAPHLVAGENVIGAIVGHGWYGSPKLWARLHLTFAEGSEQTLRTGASANPPWFVRTGPLRYDSLYEGERYDARLELPGWDAPGYVMDRAQWRMVSYIEPPGGELVARSCEPVRVVETLVPAPCSQPDPNVFVFDVGQNIAGWARLSVEAPAGTRVRLRFAENLDDSGRLHPGTNRCLEVFDEYICAGRGVEQWEPRFTYHGFRYVEVTGLPQPPSIEVCVVRTDVKPVGAFSSDNPLLDGILDAIRRTEAGNLHGIPTDCPQRDERLGWLNDMTSRAECAMPLFDMARFYPKWVQDIADTQDSATGAIADTAPFRWGRRPADPVAACYVTIPWLLYMHHGDTTTMARHFDGMRAWLDYLHSRTEDGIVSYSYYGDWAPPIGEGTAGSIGQGAVSLKTPGPLISTAYYIQCRQLLAEMAIVLGGDPTDHHQRAQISYEAYNNAFWDEAVGGYGTNNQACNAISLALRLVPPERVARTVASLVKDVTEHDDHLTTGNQCTKHLLEALSEHGHVDLAYRIATQQTYPSWGYMLAQGATTIWERWEHVKAGGMHSHNHPMHGAIGAWYFKCLLGIQPLAPGFARVRIAPRVPAELKWARGHLNTVRGRIAVEWTQAEPGQPQISWTVPEGVAVESNARSTAGQPGHSVLAGRAN